MTAHDHSTLVEGCYRCELGRDEVCDDTQARAAEVIARSWVDTSTLGVGYDGMSAEKRRYLTDRATVLVLALDRAGLLATPERDAEARAEAERLRTALIALIAGWEDTGRSDLHPLIRGAALSAAGQVRDALWPEEADDE